MFKKIMSLALSIFMILAFMPTKSNAVDEYPLWVGGEQVTSEHTSGTGWSYTGNGSSGTLTLNNANITGSINPTPSSTDPRANICFDHSDYNLTINLIGENHLSTAEAGIYAVGDDTSLTITGDGSLEISAIFHGIFSQYDLSIDNTTLTVLNSNISSGGTTTINNSTVKVTESGYSLGDNITYPGGVGLSTGNLNITNSTVNATSHGDAAISSRESISISGNSYIDATGAYGSRAIHTQNGQISIGNELDIIEPTDGVVSPDGKTINDSSGNDTSRAVIGHPYNISASAFPDIGGTVDGSGTYAGRTTATVTATPANGHSFVKWTENNQTVSTNASYSFTVTNDRNLVANFEPILYLITTTANPTEGGAVEGGGSHYYITRVTLTASANEGYDFVHWSDGSTENPRTITVTENQTFTADFEKQKYTVDFKNYDNSILQSGSFDYGETPAYNGETPTRPSTDQYSYSFLAWTPSIVPVTDNAIYTATYSQTTNEYDIKFLNDDGTQLQSSSVPYGEIPVYNGETPTKPSTDQYIYTFAGWDSEIVPVTGEAIYTATYSAEDNTEHSKSESDSDGISEITDENDDKKDDTKTAKTDTPDDQTDNTDTSESSSASDALPTGDATHLAIWISLISVSFVFPALVFILGKKRTKKYKHCK